jgi:hypothetical protein
VARLFTKVYPVRVVVDVIDHQPHWSLARNSPEITLRVKVTYIYTGVAARGEPLWLKGIVKVNPDRTFNILSLSPEYGSVQGLRAQPILNVYKDTLTKVLQDTDLALLGVLR